MSNKKFKYEFVNECDDPDVCGLDYHEPFAEQVLVSANMFFVNQNPYIQLYVTVLLYVILEGTGVWEFIRVRGAPQLTAVNNYYSNCLTYISLEKIIINHCTLGQIEGSRGHTTFIYYATWIGKCIIFAIMKSLRQKKLK